MTSYWVFNCDYQQPKSPYTARRRGRLTLEALRKTSSYN